MTETHRQLSRHYGKTMPVVVVILLIVALILGYFGWRHLTNGVLVEVNYPDAGLSDEDKEAAEAALQRYQAHYGDDGVPDDLLVETGDRFEGLANPDNVQDGASISNYETFKADFKEKTGKDWDTFKDVALTKLDAVEDWDGQVPSVDPLLSQIQTARDSGELAGNDLARLDQIEARAKSVADQVKQFDAMLKGVKVESADVRAAFTTVIEQAERLDGRSEAEAEPLINALLEERVPALFAEVESLQNGPLQENLRAAKVALDDLDSARKALDELLTAAEQVPALAEVVSEGKDFIDQVDTAVKAGTAMAQALPAIASAMEHMAVWAAANPALAAAIVGALLLAMLLVSLFGDGDSDSDGTSQGGGTAFDDAIPGTEPTGDSEVEPNPGNDLPPTDFDNVLPPTTSTPASNVGGSADGDIVYQPYFDGQTFVLLVKIPEVGSHLLRVEPGAHSFTKLDDRLGEVRRETRKINVKSIAYNREAGGPLPIAFTFSGLSEAGNVDDVQNTTLIFGADGQLLHVEALR